MALITYELDDGICVTGFVPPHLLGYFETECVDENWTTVLIGTSMQWNQNSPCMQNCYLKSFQYVNSDFSHLNDFYPMTAFIAGLKQMAAETKEDKTCTYV